MAAPGKPENSTAGLDARLAGLHVDPGRPLLICDADEVLFTFMDCFERHLHDHGAVFNWASYRLNGNILSQATGEPLDVPAVGDLIGRFFDLHTRSIPAVKGAAEALRALSGRLQIVILSNVPRHRKADRAWALRKHGMDFPLVANEGPKGEAVALLAARTEAPVFFVDDAPSHHADVARLAERVQRIHFVCHPRLGPLVGPAEACDTRALSWAEIRAYIEAGLDREGY